MNSIQQIALRCKNDTKAVTALEYGMIAALITVVLITGFATLGNKLSTTLSTISNVFPAGWRCKRHGAWRNLLLPCRRFA